MNDSSLRRRLLVLLALVALSPLSHAFTPQSIHFDGLARVSSATALQSSELIPGRTLSSYDVGQAVRQLYASGLFDDVVAERRDDALWFRVVERPAISLIEIDGTKAVSKDVLLGALRDSGVREGEILDRSKIELIRAELVRQYGSIGLYNAEVTVRQEPRPNNRVELYIDVVEGRPAFIRSIQLAGGEAFSEDELKARALSQRERRAGDLWNQILKRDRFSQQSLNADKQSLEAWYLDRGYIDFEISSSQVALAPDRQGLYLTFNLNEGEAYRMQNQQVTGEAKEYGPELESMIRLQPGELFSRAEVIASQQAMLNYLTDRGYFFAQVNVLPEVDSDNLLLDISYQVVLGNKVYVRNIEFRGNLGTNDQTLRREMVQRERSLSRARDVRAGRERLARLGLFASVDVQTPQVAGRPDQIDVVYTVVEKNTGSVNGSVGYSDVSGLFVSGEITQQNVFGTGHSLAAKVQINQFDQEVTLSYDVPYVTESGIGLGADVYGRRTNFDKVTFSNYRTDNYGIRVRLGYPTSRNSRLTWQLGYEHTDLYINDAAAEIQDFSAAMGDSFNNVNLLASWVYSDLNNSFNPTSGRRHRLSAELGLPVADLTYYKLRYRQDRFWPLADDFAIGWQADLAYGDAYGDLDVLPFLQNYRAGGPGSVRGFDGGSLGPRNSIGAPHGGNLLSRTGLEFVFPVPFIDNKSPWRTSLFVDAGNVFSTQCHPSSAAANHCQEGWDLGQIRYSAGLDVTWRTPIAPLNFVFAVPLNAADDDRTRGFNFSIRSGF